jgi:restriction system protein
MQNSLLKLSNAEFENIIARIVSSMGYITEIVPINYDVGIDVIARKDNEKLAIQVKKYIDRKINLDMVYHTYGACAYYDCTKPVIATLGSLTLNAEKVAKKLNVSIWDYDYIASLIDKLDIADSLQEKGEREEFEDLWLCHFRKLEGKRVSHLKRDTFILIQKVDDNGIFEISSNGKKKFFPISIFRWAITQLKENGVLTRSDINDEYKGRGSSAISAILSTLPSVVIDETESKITLRWKK